MINLRMRKILALGTMTCLMVFFQNCSDIQSSMLLQGTDAADANGGVAGTGDLTVLDPQPPGNAGPGDGGDTIVVDVIDNPPVPNPTRDTAVVDGDDDLTDVAVTEVDSLPTVDFSAACKELKQFAIANVLTDVKNVEGVQGRVVVKSNQVDLIQDHSSVLVVTGNTSAAMVKQIRNVHGQTIICNAVVDRIDSVFGTLVLVDSIVNNLDDQHGRLVLIRSKIGNRVEGKIK